MKTVSDLLDLKGRHVHTIEPAESVVACATLMSEHAVGSLVVVERDKPIGIVTRNDVIEAVAKNPTLVERTPVSEIMATRLETTGTSADLLEIRDHMVAKEIRHMPILEKGQLVGLITLADLLFLELDEAHVMNKHFQDYMFGPYF
jgi:CBS domain-containing protein